MLILKMPGNDMKLKMYEISRLNPGDIDSISVLKDTSAIKLYGKEGRFGVVIIKMKKSSKIADSCTDIYSLNNVIINSKPLKSYNLPVYIDSLYVNRPEKVDMMMPQVKSATINTEPTTGIKFINIITYKDDIPTKSEDQKEKSKNDGIQIMIR